MGNKHTPTDAGKSYGITGGMSIPKFAKLVGVDAETMRELIATGEGPNVIRIPGAKRDTIRIMPSQAVAWLRANEE